MRKMIVVLSSVFVALGAQAKDLAHPESLMYLVGDHFPGQVKNAGGLSSELDLQSLSCFISASKKDNEWKQDTKCRAVTAEGDSIERTSGVNELVLALIHSGMPLKKDDGVTYIEAKKLNCFLDVCQSSDPAVCADVKPTYSCSVDE